MELALRMALASREPEASLLHHSDRGSEFTSERYQAALRELGIQVSMSRTGNVSDNAAMESFFATLTRGMSQSNALSHASRARTAIFEYLECFYVRSVRSSATIFEGVPTMFLYLLNYPDLEHYDLSSLTRCTVGGQTMPVTKMREVETRLRQL